MKSSMLIFLLAFSLSLAGCASKTELKGQIVFDAPPEEVYKIGRDHIRVISEEEMTSFIKQVEAETSEVAEPGSFKAVYEHGAFALLRLPKLKAVQEVTTDDEGNFSITLPAKGRVALVVDIKRSIKRVDESPKYYWIVWVTLEKQKSLNVILNNDNRLRWNTFSDSSNLKYIKSL